MDSVMIFSLFFFNFGIIDAGLLSTTLSWTAEKPPSTKVHFHGRYGFVEGQGPGCGAPFLPGVFASNLRDDNMLACTQGCSNVQNITAGGDLNYYCASFKLHEWEQGDKYFTFSPAPSTDQFTVSYTGQPRIHHDFGGTGNVYFQTTVDLRIRNDTSKPNTSPITSSLPVYYVPFDCISSIKIPVYDSDDDLVTCRWSAGIECGGVCNGLPESNLDTQRCILTIQPKLVTGFVHNGTYIVTLTVEDSPKTTISVGSSTVHPNDALSQIPLQFVVKATSYSGVCGSVPTITLPTHKNGQVFIIPKSESFKQTVYARHHSPATSITEFVHSVPFGMTPGPITTAGLDVSTEFTWIPKFPDQYTSDIMCFQAVDNNGLYSEQHCFILLAGVEDPCKSNPCEHGGSCTIELDTYVCACTPEYEGRNCQLDVNDCLSSPCENGGTCWDQVGGFQCFCPIGFMGTNCSETDFCASSPCKNFGTCTTTPTGYTCTCSQGYSGPNCNTDLDECSSGPCENGGTCTDMVGDFFCECPIDFKGKNCSIPNDFCNPNPCENNGVCTNYKDSYRCSCPSGYIGLDCEIYQPESCGSDDDNHCMCLLNGRRVKLPFPQQKQEGFTTEDLVAGIVGIPIGIVTGVILCVLFHKLIRPRCFKTSDGINSPRSRPPSSSSFSSSTKSLISNDSTITTRDIRPSLQSPIFSTSPGPLPTNVYRGNHSTDWR